jgi:hypothetical protein
MDSMYLPVLLLLLVVLYYSTRTNLTVAPAACKTNFAHSEAIKALTAPDYY